MGLTKLKAFVTKSWQAQSTHLLEVVQQGGGEGGSYSIDGLNLGTNSSFSQKK